EHEGCHFIHTRHQGLYFVINVGSSDSPFLYIDLLNRLASLIRDYCGDLSESVVRLNFALIYELLDEVLDYGYIQTTSTDMLKNFIQCDPVVIKPFNLLDLSIWSRDSTKQGGSEFSFQSACPLLTTSTGYGSAVRVDSCQFHESVKLDEFEVSRILKVLPPQGELTVMQYQISDSLSTSLPFHLFPSVERDPRSSRLQIFLKLRCDLSPKSVSQELSSPDQSAELSLSTQSLTWNVPRIRGGSQLSALFKVDVSGCVSLPSVLDLPPVNLSFQVPSHTSSGLQIRFLRLRNERPTAIHTWVRYLTQSDSYSVRLG
ncbi:hypothetical protein AB205_0060730, partial [Aquarana catesbeiana]